MVEVVFPSRTYGKSGTQVLYPANIQRRDRRGFIQLPYSIRLHCARGLQAKILICAEENQVETNVF
jgi:hypothetical protein